MMPRAATGFAPRSVAVGGGGTGLLPTALAPS